jgi:hypothetical protein
MIRMTLLTIVFAATVLFEPGVTSGDIVDLMTAGSSGSIDGVYFRQFDPADSTGTGRIDPFLRIQGSGGVERGYNTTGPVEYDTKDATALSINELSLALVNGVACYEFLLDVNEPGGSKSLISLDGLKLYVAAGANLDDSQLGTPVYDMDATSDNTVLLDGGLVGSGSGDGDMLLIVPAYLIGYDAANYIYLYSELGQTRSAEGGFEEWAVVPPNEMYHTPEPMTLMLVGTGTLMLVGCRRRRAC